MIIESFRRKKQSRKLPKPLRGNQQLQRKALEPSAHTYSDTSTHAHLNMWTQKQQKPKPPKIKTVRLAHPQQ